MKVTNEALEDAKRVLELLEELDKLNAKYGYPYGENPIGIAIYAMKILTREGQL